MAALLAVIGYSTCLQMAPSLLVGASVPGLAGVPGVVPLWTGFQCLALVAGGGGGPSSACHQGPGLTLTSADGNAIADSWTCGKLLNKTDLEAEPMVRYSLPDLVSTTLSSKHYFKTENNRRGGGRAPVLYFTVVGNPPARRGGEGTPPRVTERDHRWPRPAPSQRHGEKFFVT